MTRGQKKNMYILQLVTVQDVAVSTAAPSRPSQPPASSSPSDSSIAPPPTPPIMTAPASASPPTGAPRPNISQGSALAAESPQSSMPDQALQPDKAPAADSSEASTSGAQGDSPKARWSDVAASPEASQEAQGGMGRPRGVSPSDRAGTPPGAAGKGLGRAAGVPRSSSSASAATQDSASECARTDSAGSLRDPAGSERRASGAAAGMFWSGQIVGLAISELSQ